MKRIVPYLFSVLLGLALGAGGTALAVNSPKSATASSPFVNPAPASPGLPSKLVMGGAASVSSTQGAGKCLRVSCTVDSSYRVGLGSQTAVADDNQLPAATPERFCLNSAQDTVAFFTAAAGNCYVAQTGL